MRRLAAENPGNSGEIRGKPGKPGGVDMGAFSQKKHQKTLQTGCFRAFRGGVRRGLAACLASVRVVCCSCRPEFRGIPGKTGENRGNPGEGLGGPSMGQ